MPSSGLIRWGGLATMLAGVAFAGSALVGLAFGLGPNALLPALLFACAFGLLAVGFVGFHALQKANYGLIGRAGFYLLVVVFSVLFVGRVVLALSGSETYWILDVGSLGVLVGFVLYGVATLQARVLPLWCGVAIIVGLPLRFAMFPIDPWGLVVFGLLWLALGYVLWSRSEAVAEQRTPRVV